MPAPIVELSAKDRFLCVGLMSGTSMDGVDAVLIDVGAERVPGHLEVKAFEVTPYPDELRTSLRDVAFGESCTAEDIACLHTSVAVAFASAFHNVCRRGDVDPASVDFIGCHGQTVAHVPPSEGGMHLISGTLQLGPPGAIAALTGRLTVGDFRVADMALGGQGAPLAPYVDFLLRRSTTANRLILNIGGIANVSYLPRDGGLEDVIAFDTGPGNMIIDELFRVLYPKESGFEALDVHLLAGKSVGSLVETFLDHPYFTRKPPKSAGHREFGGAFAWEFLSRGEGAGLKRDDILASAATLTTRSAFEACREFVYPVGAVDEVYVTGGGRNNPAMMRELGMMFAPAIVGPIDELGIPADAKEAVDFAILARDAILERPNSARHATGASAPLVLGTIAHGGTL